MLTLVPSETVVLEIDFRARRLVSKTVVPAYPETGMDRLMHAVWGISPNHPSLFDAPDGAA